MPVLTGKNGTVKTGNSVYASATEFKITEWSMNITGGALDVTDAGSGDWREKVPGKRASANGSFTAIHKTDSVDFTVNTEVEAHLVENDVSAAEYYWSGKIIITDMGLSVPIEGEDVVKTTFSFESNGAMTKTDNAA